MTLSAILFGVTGLIATGGFVQDIFLQLGEALIHSQTGHLQLLKPGYYESGSRNPERYRIDDPEAALREVSAKPEVASVMRRIAFTGLLNNGRADINILAEGVEPDKEAKLGTSMKILAGRALSDRDTRGIALGQGVAQALKLGPGDQATLVATTPEGALNSLDVDVVGVFQSYSKDFDARAVRLPLAAAQELLGTDAVNSLVVALHRTSDTEAVARSLRAGVGGIQYDVRTWQQLNDFYDKTVALYERQFGVLQLIILIMVLLSVANSVNMTVFERVGEFGTMLALGNSRRTITSLILVENALLGLAGAAFGVAFGILVAWGVSGIGIPMPPPPNANAGYTARIQIVPDVVMTAFLVGAFATFLAGVVPAFRIARTPVVDALRANY
jgi:putative ABC transport system permease protein